VLRLFTPLAHITLLFALTCAAAMAAEPTAYQKTIDSLLERMKQEKSAEELMRFRVKDVTEMLTAEERDVLSHQYLRFTINEPAVVTIWRAAAQREVPFWLEADGFKKADVQLVWEKVRFEAWEKAFDAGEVGLGFNALDGFDVHYFVTLRPQAEGAGLTVSDIQPRLGHSRGKLEEGAFFWSDDPDSKLENIPDNLEGQLLIRTPEKRSREDKVVGRWRETSYPAQPQPDQIVLTWAADPTTTQTVQWRGSTAITAGQVKFQLADGSGEITTLDAELSVLEDRFLVNDPLCHRFTATMEGLQPDTEYKYQVGNLPDGHWSEWATFRTAPDKVKPFQFVYMGDAQNGLDDWGRLVRGCFEKFPEAHFYIMAGDLVNRGNDRDDWDLLFHNGSPVYRHRQLVPSLGNHEMGGIRNPWMYLSLFDLPENGSPKIGPERSYSLRYSNALFIVLDSNDKLKEQAEWLEETLASTDAKWKFVVYHHPAYSSGPQRDNILLRDTWTPIFDKYHVDLALQGHDHAYLRTYPMYDQKRVAQPKDGTIYIVSVSGPKFYDQDPRDYTEVGFTKSNVFQLLDIQIEGNKLTYHSYDEAGNVKDSFVIEK
jgi:hypothetical protein